MKRRRLSPSARAALLKKQGGRCCVRGCDETRSLIEEHSTPFTWTGALPDQLMCVPCHKKKTARDIKNIAKVNRLTGKTSSQDSRRKKRGYSLIQGKTKIESRGFETKRKCPRCKGEAGFFDCHLGCGGMGWIKVKKPMRGKVERRT